MTYCRDREVREIRDHGRVERERLRAALRALGEDPDGAGGARGQGDGRRGGPRYEYLTFVTFLVNKTHTLSISSHRHNLTMDDLVPSDDDGGR